MFLLDAVRKLERRPDLAFVSYERWARNRPVPRTPAWDVIPDLVIEVISPSNSASGVLVKVGEYFRHGVREVWVVYPLEEQVYVYRSPTSVRVLTRSDLLESTGYPPGLPVAARAALRGGEPVGMSRGRAKPLTRRVRRPRSGCLPARFSASLDRQPQKCRVANMLRNRPS